MKPIEQLTEAEKYSVWIDYMVNQTAAKHDFFTVDLTKPNALHGYGKPDKTVCNTAFFKTFRSWPKIDAMPFREFTDPNNESSPNYHGGIGIYDYYPKFHNRIFPQ